MRANDTNEMQYEYTNVGFIRIICNYLYHWYQFVYWHRISIFVL